MPPKKNPPSSGILQPLDASARQTRRFKEAVAAEKATEAQWEMVNTAITAFAAKYPSHWHAFLKSLQDGRTEYAEAKGDGLRHAQWRHTASFPIIYAKNEVGDTVEVDALLPVLDNIIPGLTNKKSKNYAEFLRRFPVFSPADKSNTSKY